MSNIHSIRDYPSSSSNSNERRYQPVGGGTPTSRHTQQQPSNQGFNMFAQAGDEKGISMLSPPPNPDGTDSGIWQKIFPRMDWLTVTTILSIIQLILFLTELIVGGVKFDGAFVKTNKMAGPSVLTLKYMGGKWEPGIRNSYELWRLFTAIFLHAGVVHIAGNMFVQLRFGYVLEARWNWKRYLLIYIVSGLCASLWSCVLSYDSVSVGASGAIAGLLGADAAYLIYNWSEIPHRGQEAIFLVLMIIVNLLMGLSTTGIDNWAHFGGLVTGFVLGAWVPHGLVSRPKELYIRGAAAILFFGLLLLFILLLWVGTPGGITTS